MELLKITAMMRTGVVTDRFLPLEGILLYYACRSEFGFPALSLPGGDDGFELPRLPLAIKHEDAEHWYYACSWAFPHPWWVAEARDHWNKRFDSALADLVDFRGRRGKVEYKGGRHKAYHMPIYYRIAPQIEWYCMGDKFAIMKLLACATHIGKHTQMGWGRVERWNVEEWPEDWSSYGPDGQLMRGVPFVPGEKAIGNILNYAIRAPGYMRQNQMMLMVPDYETNSCNPNLE